MLWSMAGNMAMVYRIFMGLEFQENDGLYFNPVCPKVYGSTKFVNYKYRNAILNITVGGHGTKSKGNHQ
ncbi:MAG: hypothetical protein IPN72_08775 [Saprospiraceae bacterium]|nr:hypothetical protein [Saprospiraceae bacterium]